MYDENGKPVDDGGGFSLWAVVFAVIGAILLTVFVCYDANSVPVDEPEPTYQLVLDCSNSALMHSFGMPTKADVYEWHVFGSWGWLDSNGKHIHENLPGGPDAWDTLYEVDVHNKAFRY